MKQYHVNKQTLAIAFLIILYSYFIIICLLGYVTMPSPMWKIILFYVAMGGADTFFVGLMLYVPYMIVVHDDSISIQYIFPRSRNKVIPLEEIGHIYYPVMKKSMGMPHRVIEILCKNGRMVTLDITYIRFTKYLDTLKITRRLNNDILWF